MASRLKAVFQPRMISLPESVALLVLRCVAGSAFMLHGWGKIQNPLAWIPEQAPFQIPGFLQALAALSEFGGGAAWILGLMTPLASTGLGITMLTAFSIHRFVFGDPFLSPGPGQGSYELALVFLAISVVIGTVGPGRFSLDQLIFKPRARD